MTFIDVACEMKRNRSASNSQLSERISSACCLILRGFRPRFVASVIIKDFEILTVVQILGEFCPRFIASTHLVV